MLTQTQAFLKEHGITIDPKLDEQQLVDQSIIIRLVDAANVTTNDTVIEIGPGIGNITELLAKKSLQVVTIEKSQKFIKPLKERLQRFPNVEIIEGDALKIKWPNFDKLVSNIPYSVAEALIQRLTSVRFDIATLIVPKKFSNTLTYRREDNEFTKLSFISSLFFVVHEIFTIPVSAYFPEPRTRTVIITLQPLQSVQPWDLVLKKILLQQSKKTRNALKESLIQSTVPSYPSTKRNAEKFIRNLNLNPRLMEKRVARLTLKDLELLRTKLIG